MRGPRIYRAEVNIAAPAERVWQILVDLPAYPTWNPFTVAVASTLVVGAPVVLHVMLRGRRIRQVERVRRVEPPRELVWGVRQGGPLLWAERVQTVEPAGRGQSHYVTVDTIGGPLSWLVEKLFGDSLRAGFSAMAEALKRQAERA